MSDTKSEWVSLRHAADILGVHPATVRNWADKGELSSRRTAGGHRRFRRADLLRHAETQGNHAHNEEVQIILQNALGQTRMQVGDGNLNDVAWYTAMSEDTRTQLRRQGRQVLEAMRTYLVSHDADENLATAVNLGKIYAKHLHGDGLSLPQAIRGFFYFSDLVQDSILTWTEVTNPQDTTEWSALLRQVHDFTHTMLLSIVEYYEED